MQAWLAGLLVQLIPKLLEYLWGVASEEIKDQLAKKQYGDYISGLIQKHQDLSKKFEELQKTNSLNETEIGKLRAEKIRLESAILNSKHP